MILLYLQTEAVKTRSREIELGRSMNHWLTSMGIDNGGKTYKLVREQSKRLSLCRLTFYKETPNATLVTNGSFELPSVPDYQVVPTGTGTAWSFSGTAGVAHNNGGTYNPNTTAGSQATLNRGN